MIQEYIQFPTEWKIKKLTELVKSKQKGIKPKFIFSENRDELLPYLDVSSFGRNGSRSYGKPSDGVVCKSSDILIVWDGSIGKVKMDVEGLVGSTIMLLTCSEEIIPQYLYYFLMSKFELIRKNKTTGPIPHIKSDFFWNLDVPYPPLKTQHKLIKKIAQSLIQFNKKRTEIEKLQEKITNEKFLENTNAFFLGQMFLGKYTEHWRRIHSKINNGYTILENILKTNDRKISTIVDSELDIPNTWAICTMGDIFEIKGGIQKTPERRPSKNPYPYLRVGNVYKNNLDLNRIEYFEIADNDELEKYRLKTGDLLVVEGNGSVDQIGRSAIWHDEIQDCVHQNHIIRCRPMSGINSEFISYYLTSPIGRDLLVKAARTTSGLYNLSVGKISSMMVCLPPIEEQTEIVKLINNYSNKVETIQMKVQQNHLDRIEMLVKLNKIPYSILDVAFSGKLVQ